MHDYDRTQLESDDEWETAVADDEWEWEAEGEFEGDFDGELEGDFEGEWEADAYEFEEEGVLDEATEMEYAAALLEMEDEEELEQFLGSLVRRAARKAGRALRSPTARVLGGVLRKAGRAALPHLKRAGRSALTSLGDSVGGRVAGRRGARGGRRIGSGLSDVLGLELEGLAPDEQEFEAARALVRVAADAAGKAAKAQTAMPPGEAATKAAASAARRFAPGLVPVIVRGGHGGRTGLGGRGTSSGRWTRRGRQIVVHGA